MSSFSAGEWYPPHIIDDNTTCNCTSIVSDGGMFGGIADIHVFNGIDNITEGGNDCPPMEEAKANARLITKSPDMYHLLKKIGDEYNDELPTGLLIQIDKLLARIDGTIEFREENK